jgi:hypothetical protein
MSKLSVAEIGALDLNTNLVLSTENGIMTIKNTGRISMGVSDPWVHPSDGVSCVLTIVDTEPYYDNYEDPSYASLVAAVGPSSNYPRIEVIGVGGSEFSLNTGGQGPEFSVLKQRGGQTSPEATQSGEFFGSLNYRGWNSTLQGFSGGAIYAYQDGDATSTGNPTALGFNVNNGGNQYGYVAARIRNNGIFLINNDQNSLGGEGGWGQLGVRVNESNMIAIKGLAGSLSQTNDVLRSEALRSASSDFGFFRAVSSAGGTPDTEFLLRGDGNAFADVAWNGGGADYAEYFEWSDGNPHDQDRRGWSVVLESGKIRPAQETDSLEHIIGVVSTQPVVVGDSAWNDWNHKYLKDDLGSDIWEEYQILAWQETQTVAQVYGEPQSQIVTIEYPADEIPDHVQVPDHALIKTQRRRKLNPDYDPHRTYVSREDRKEWSPVGLMGKLRILKNQPKGDRWIFMEEVSDQVEIWLVR